MNDVSHLMVQRNRAATSVLAALMVHGRKGKAGVAPDFDWLTGMLSYVEEIVTRQHYRYEETWLLKPLEQLMPELRPRLARMRRDHVGAGGYCVRMAEALAHWRRGWAKEADRYLDNARDHFRLSVSHGRLLRETILPAAERCFGQAQWQSAAVALARSEDPVALSQGRAGYEAALCRRMGRAAPPQAVARIDPDQSRGAGARAYFVGRAQEAG